MKYRLNDGSIVDPNTHERHAEKCGCVTHTGPHWLYMNDSWYERNKAFMLSNPKRFVIEECNRLEDLERNMVIRRIEEIIREK